MAKSVNRFSTVGAVVVLLSMASNGRGAEVLGLSETAAGLPLTPFMTVYRDTTGARTLAEVQKEAQRGQFAPCSVGGPSFGFTKDAIWARLAVQSASRADSLWFIELPTARLDEVDAYIIPASGPVEHMMAGNMQERSPQTVDDRWPVFPLPVKRGEKAEVFVRAHSDTAIHLRLRIWDSKAFAAAQPWREAPVAASLGYLGALIVFGFVLSLFVHDRGYAIYSMLVIGSFGLILIISGYYGWLGLPGRAFMAKKGMILVCEYALYMLMLCIQYLLDLARTLPGVDRWSDRLRWSIVASAGVFLAIPFRIMYPLFAVQVLLVEVCMLSTTLAAWRRGNRVARRYSLAWVLFGAVLLGGLLKFFAWMPMLDPPESAVVLGNALSFTLLLIVATDRVGEMRQNMQQAQAQALDLEGKAVVELRSQMRQEQCLIRDLHDGIGGLTANLALLAELGRRDAPIDIDRERFARISQLASEGGAEVRSLIGSLEARGMSWPDFFDDCRRHGNLLLPPYGMRFSFADTGYDGQPGPGLLPGLSLLRVVKEALTNAVKHSGCTEVTVLAQFSPQQLRLTVRDNGRGMQAERTDGRGLRNMDSRIREMGGTVTCRSQGGMELVFELPLPLNRLSSPDEVEA